jgi:hypothetical protein
MGNLNRRRGIGAARAAVLDDGGCLSRAAQQKFTADGPLARAHGRVMSAFPPIVTELLTP